MIKLPYRGYMLPKALEKAEALGEINDSITKGRGNLAGYLAEIALSEYLGADNVSCKDGRDKYNYDLIHNGRHIEVKTKRRSVDPKPSYEVSIAETSSHQQPDIYAFISITFKHKEGKGLNTIYKEVESIWLCGFMNRDEFFEKARYIPKGELDPTNGFVSHRSMYNLPIGCLSVDLPL